LRQKPFFRDEVQQNSLGSPPNNELLELLQPKWWFAAHLHVKFKATVQHKTQNKVAAVAVSNSVSSLVPSQVAVSSTSKVLPAVAENVDDKEVESRPEETTEAKATTTFLSPESTDPCAGPDLTDLMTQFLSLDKCLPRRQYLSIVHIPVEERKSDARLEYDPEWLAILRKTHNLTETGRRRVKLPTQPETVTSEEIAWVREQLGQALVIPENCRMTVPPHSGPTHPIPSHLPQPFRMMGNPQTDQLLNILQLNHILTVPYHENVAEHGWTAHSAKVVDDNEVDIDDVEDDDGDGDDGDDGDDGQAVNMKDENEIELELDFVLDYAGDDSGPSDANKKPRMEH
jgi:lariat debranching enzyme